MYLGVTLDAGCSFKPTLEDLSEKATRAIFAINNRFKFSKIPIKTALKLFDTSVAPIDHDFDKSNVNEIENTHLQFCQHILG